jgi:hypothetical protein
MSNRSKTQTSCPLIVLMMVSVVTGCTAEVHRYVRFPDFMSPGWAQQQRAEAIEHDPYPLNDVGPEVVGGRPLAYLQSVPEVERARMNTSPPMAFQPIPIPALPAAPPSFVSPPPVVTTPFPTAPVSTQPVQVRPRNPY